MSDEPALAPPSSSAFATLRERPRLWAVLPGVLLVVVGLAVFFVVLDGVQEKDDLWDLDQPVLEWLVAHRTAAWTTVLAAITFVTGPTVLPFIVGLACLVWGLVRHEWWRPLLLAGAMIASTLISLAVKGLVGRARPPEDTMYVPGAETTASFPSGHTIGTATFLLVVGYLACSRTPSVTRIVVSSIVTVVGTALVAVSRLYLGYHFLTDVVAAVALAIGVLGAVSVVDRLHTLALRAG
ncbi:phosphatase PAP2 family protein [Cellulomonas fengjieae]|uniref:Phosphatase PAP2 family protein n=1 Tax=Cellulomonas fengjieae TaxID=2819978 RepID=A0ABS3SHY1_9CELL|nr:phosphatase PAP2 family protein [Cellulomonas fengjieae]MBO3084576.1 phosphatase PAP2 family protein [Cellulomonas fengjieae]MBO3103348.1 phosphatase PAP2 family protein [Cellulomonas fengjieae]QVI67091.1 phosphatase PAP2 family protein [Cellulomonas fengjieae]